MMKDQVFRANGKLLLTGEYAVLDGARALALPTRRGQILRVREVSLRVPTLLWQSVTVTGKVWFDAVFNTRDFELVSATDAAVGQRLQQMLRYIKIQRPSFLADGSYSVQTELEFDRAWGLGSSSTLIACLAQWGGVNAFDLLFNTMKGSGYDVACGLEDRALVYQLNNGVPSYEVVDYVPPFQEQLYFVYRGQKQNSREGIARYRAQATEGRQALLERIDAITMALLNVTELAAFEEALHEHEALIGEAVGIVPVQDSHFSDYDWGIVKSLGAWGGDFVLVTSNQSSTKTSSYFESRGCTACQSYNEMIKNHGF